MLAGLVLKREFQVPFSNPIGDKCSIEFFGAALEFRGQGAASQVISYIIESTPNKVYLIEEVADTNIPENRNEYRGKPIRISRQ